jgi:site-specific DNA recombinase
VTAKTARAAIYARVSTDEQVAGTSLGTQLDRCRTHIAAQGWTLVGEFVDEGVSGAKASRPQLDRLMDGVGRGSFDVVVIAKLDRIGRSMRNLAQLMGELDDRGVALVSISESFDSLTPAGRLQRNMLGSFAEFERAMIRERMMTGVEATALAGNWPCGRTPFGFRTVRRGRSSVLEIDEAEANVVRKAVELILEERLNSVQAATRLNAAGLRPRSAPRWTASSLRKLISAEWLSGTYQWRRAGRGAKTGPPVSLAIPPLISSQLHDRLRARVAQTAQAKSGHAEQYLLSGRLRSACGATMWGIGAPTKPSYRCSGRYAQPLSPEERCACRTVNARYADAIVWEQVQAVLTDSDRLLAMAGLELDRAETSLTLGSENLTTLDRRIARLAKAAGEQLAAMLAKGLDPAIAQQAMTSLGEDLAATRSARDRLAAWQQSNAQVVDRTQRLLSLVAGAAQMLPRAELETRRRVLELLEVQVSVSAWESCSTCGGRGSFGVKGVGGKASREPGARASPCPTCLGSRAIPLLQIRGVIPELPSLEAPLGAGDEVPRWPFVLSALK